MTTAKETIHAIKEAKGFVTTAARHLGISRTQLYRLINAHPTVKEALGDAREEMKDFAEAQLFKNIRDGKETSLIFYLKTQAKDRGYIERQELDHGGDVTINVVYGERGQKGDEPNEITNGQS